MIHNVNPGLSALKKTNSIWSSAYGRLTLIVTTLLLLVAVPAVNAQQQPAAQPQAQAGSQPPAQPQPAAQQQPAKQPKQQPQLKKTGPAGPAGVVPTPVHSVPRKPVPPKQDAGPQNSTAGQKATTKQPAASTTASATTTHSISTKPHTPAAQPAATKKTASTAHTSAGNQPASKAQATPAARPADTTKAAPKAPPAPMTDAQKAAVRGKFGTGTGNYRACLKGDDAPDGTVTDGFKKMVVPTPMGESCHWEKVE